MKIVPYENIVYHSHHSKQEVLERLKNFIEAPKGLVKLRSLKNSKQRRYQGFMYNSTFNMRRIIGYQNSFLPRIEGVVEQDGTGSIIRVKMKLYTPLLVMMIIISSILLAFGIVDILKRGLTHFQPDSLFPFGVILIIYLMCTVLFYIESNLKNEKFVKKIKIKHLLVNFITNILNKNDVL